MKPHVPVSYTYSYTQISSIQTDVGVRYRSFGFPAGDPCRKLSSLPGQPAARSAAQRTALQCPRIPPVETPAHDYEQRLRWTVFGLVILNRFP